MKWLIVAILFSGDEVVSSRMFSLNPETVQTREDCDKEKAAFREEAKKRDADVFLECIEVKREPKLKKERDS